MRRVWMIGSALVCAAGAAAGATVTNTRAGLGPAPTIAATAIASPAESVKIDGHLSDATWNRTTPVTEFKQREPDEGADPTHPTDVRVAYDAAAIYVAVSATEPDTDRIVGMLTRRDESSPSDWIRVAFDSFRDRRTAYEFAVNAAGVKQDRYWFGDTNNDPGWDAVWDVAVSRTATGWNAEFRIPFSQLRFNPSAGGTFGFAVLRTVAHENETVTWPLLARSASGFVSSFGELTGLAFPASPKRLELLPYALAQLASAPVASGNPLARSPDGTGAVGLDLKYRLAPGLSLTGTVNPDFGQVEADPAVVNLGAFETFFAERRPFFVEGSGNFSFDVDCNDGQCTGLFYSRRIGRAPQRFAAAPPGGFADQPTNTTIAGAAKITGRVGRYSIGVLQALTTREEAQIATASSPDVTRTPVEPATSYTVARIGRDFDNNSRIAFAVTNTSRGLTDELSFLTRNAVSGGVDGDWRLVGGKYSLSGYWAASRVAGAPEAIDRLQRNTVHGFLRPDAETLTYDPTRTSLAGHAGSVGFSKISGQTTRFSSSAGYKSPGFEINDLGFQQRADEITQSNWFQLRRDQPGRLFRSVRLNFNQWAGWNFDRDLRYIGGNVNGSAITTNNWQFSGGVSLNGRGLADRFSRGGPSVYTNPGVNPWAFVSTDNRKPVIASVSTSGFADAHGTRSWNVSPSVTWRPTDALSVGVGVGYSRNRNQSQWVANVVDNGTPRYVFGRIDQTTVSLSARVNYTLTPTLSVQVYAQPFVSAGAYSAFKELADGRALDYEDRFAPYAFSGRPDFNIRSFRTTNVLRWEYRPGSALFVVWQQGRDGFVPAGDFRFGRDFGDALGAPATNLFLIKFSRWLNL